MAGLALSRSAVLRLLTRVSPPFARTDCRFWSQEINHVLSRSKTRRARREILRQNRRNPELEIQARTEKLRLPLEAVQSEWQDYEGRKQLQAAALHFGIYRDVFGAVFRPRGSMRVEYEGGHSVFRGNVISPAEASSAPEVVLPSDLPPDHLCTLILSNPDGHIVSSYRELLHWKIVNISDGDLASGDEVCPYLPPIPPRGTGLHRMVFILLTHATRTTVDVETSSSWLDQRTFSTHEFLSSHPDMVPHTFCFYQSQWDTTVHNTFTCTLGHPEPTYDLEKNVSTRKLKQLAVRETRSNRYRNM